MAEGVIQIFEMAQEERDEEMERISRRGLRVFKDRTNPLEEYDSTQFLQRFRISKGTFAELVDLVACDLQRPTRRSNALNPAEQLAIALRFYASGSFQMIIGDVCGVSQASCCRVIQEVTESICRRKRHFIKFPLSSDDRRAVMVGFHNIQGCPGVVGAIDGCHIRIANPGGANAVRFINRKGFYSLNCQLCCNHRMIFTNVVSRWYGSAHDSRIFEESLLCRKLKNGEIGGILLGDSAYTCTKYMLTPLRQPTSPAEIRYNQAQRKTRSVIERAFGIWKRRFPCVGNGLRCSVSTMRIFSIHYYSCLIFSVLTLARQQHEYSRCHNMPP